MSAFLDVNDMFGNEGLDYLGTSGNIWGWTFGNVENPTDTCRTG